MQSIPFGDEKVRTFKIAPHEIIPDPVVNDNSTWINVEDLVKALNSVLKLDSHMHLLQHVDHRTGLMAMIDTLRVDFLKEDNTIVTQERMKELNCDN